MGAGSRTPVSLVDEVIEDQIHGPEQCCSMGKAVGCLYKDYARSDIIFTTLMSQSDFMLPNHAWESAGAVSSQCQGAMMRSIIFDTLSTSIKCPC
jgi:hypothetical protein